MITVKLLDCCTFSERWFKLPEDGSCVETCSNKLIVKYTICRIAHMLVLIESAPIQSLLLHTSPVQAA